MASQVEQLVRAWRKADRSEESRKADFQRQERSFTMYQDDDGMFVVEGRFTPEVGAVLMKALQEAGEVRVKNEESGVDISGEEGKPKWGYAPIDWDWAIDGPLHNLGLRRKAG
ncbi:MAG: hypothetical protein ACRD21_11630 [Vicinamibacteria bacterium]